MGLRGGRAHLPAQWILHFVIALLFMGMGGRAMGAVQEATGEVAAAERLVQRVTPEYAARVRFRIVPGSATVIEPFGKRSIRITAANVRECVRAYGYYLRRYARVHLSWNGDNRSAARFFRPKGSISVPPTLPLNFAYNYCTLSYSCVHWSKERWMQEIDRLALNGFRYVLVTSGLEKVWQGFLADISAQGYKASAGAFISSPVYAAWWNMGNLEGEGGPVSQQLINSEAELGRLIVSRLRELGLEPVLQGFVGLMPHSFSAGSESIDQGKWVANYPRPNLLRADKPTFASFAKQWYRHLEEVYGYKAKAFAGDLFHEGGKVEGLPLAQISAGVQQAMQDYSPGSLWFIQAWAGNPRPELLRGTSVEHTVILQLNKDLSPNANGKFNYQGRRYVWCELANFGGNHGLYGGFDILEKLPANARNASGFGLLSEGLETNPLYYELFFERLSATGNIDRSDFLSRYALARYGSRDERLVRALHLLARSAYTPDSKREGCQENILCARPDLNADRVSTWSDPKLYYDPAHVEQAARLLLQAALDHPELMKRASFRFDLVDVCRQVLSDRGRTVLQRCKEAYEARDKARFILETEAFYSLIEQTAELVATHEDFLLGVFLSGAEERAESHADKAQMSSNLRRLITRWTSRPSELNDYAHRQFAELFRYYYLPRWKAFFNTLMKGADERKIRETVSTNNGDVVVHRSLENKEVDDIEKSFPTADIHLLLHPQGDLLTIAKKTLGMK